MTKAARFTGRVPYTTVALVVDEDQVADPDVPEAHAERVDPEVVGELGVADRDVAGDALAEAEAPEDAQGAGQLLLAVEPLVLDGREGRGTLERHLLGGQLDAVDGGDVGLNHRITSESASE